MLSPLDDRYYDKTKEVREIFSTFNFTKTKLTVECDYTQFFCDETNQECDLSLFSRIKERFTERDFERINEIRSVFND